MPTPYYNYKVDATVGTTPDHVSGKLTVLDTGARSNVVKLEAFPPDVDIDTMPLDLNLRTTSGAPLPTLGIIFVLVCKNRNLHLPTTICSRRQLKSRCIARCNLYTA